jgi:hypothetical protein
MVKEVGEMNSLKAATLKFHDSAALVSNGNCNLFAIE